MPELPDISVYLHALKARIVGRPLEAVRIASPFLLRTFDPPVSSAGGRQVTAVSRIGKRIVWHLDGDLFLVFHLMIAGRLNWRPRGVKVSSRVNLAAFDFPDGSLLFTEAGTKKRASLHLVQGREALAPFDRGGLDLFAADAEAFAEPLRRENHTLKRSLTDPRLYDGIGNAYSDEILHRARLSPLRHSRKLSGEEVGRLHRAAREVLVEWQDRLLAEAGDGFPEKVTAFHKEMAVHGKYGEPCPACGTPVQRIRYADNECNYCPACQTEGRLLADRGLSRLLGKDWPKSLEELDELRTPNHQATKPAKEHQGKPRR